MSPTLRDAIILAMFGLMLGASICAVMQYTVISSMEQQASNLE